MSDKPIIVILGPTASGKTKLAVNLANAIGGEIISADSRQVYQGMDTGTGKDLDEYVIDNQPIPYHIIDIKKAGEEYNVYDFLKDANKAQRLIEGNENYPIICGGTGFYIQSFLEGLDTPSVPIIPALRERLSDFSNTELRNKLSEYAPLHYEVDTNNHKRLTRAIEIADYLAQHDHLKPGKRKKTTCILFGIEIDRDTRRQRITERLTSRLENGLIKEVEDLLASGISPERLIYYGLEYKFITHYLKGELDYNSMFEQLNTAIHQFSKRQMTWFRKMERDGYTIHWLDYSRPLKEHLNTIQGLLTNLQLKN